MQHLASEHPLRRGQHNLHHDLGKQGRKRPGAACPKPVGEALHSQEQGPVPEPQPMLYLIRGHYAFN